MYKTSLHVRTVTGFTAALLVSSALSGGAVAQIVPDAGQVLRENQRPVTPPIAANRPTLSIPDEADTAADIGQTVIIQSIRIEGAESMPVGELEPLLEGLTGREVTLGDLRAGTRRITAHYRGRGFVVARAYIPAQEVADGTLVIRILEGRMAATGVENRTKVRDSVLQSVLDAQNLTGQVIASNSTDRALLLMADLPSVGKVSGKLRPGTEVGTSNLIVTAESGKRIEGQVSVDNHGNRYTGENRLSGQVALNSPLGLGDRLSAQATLTDEDLAYGRLAYDLPVGSDGLRLGAAASMSAYELGQEFANLDATGTARTVGFYANYPLLRSLLTNVWLTANLEHRDLEDEIASVAVTSEKSARALTFEAYGDRVDAFHGGGYTTWRLSATLGDLSIDTPTAAAVDQLGPRTAGEYKKVNFSLTRLQSLTTKTSLLASFSAQSANKNLDSSEKFVIGGIYGVRAYPQGEGSGDKGWMVNLELRHQVMQRLQVAAFYDAGHVQFSQTAYAPGEDSQDLRGYGVSAASDFGRWTGKVTVAWRDTEAATTAPDRDPRVWASLGYRF